MLWCAARKDPRSRVFLLKILSSISDKDSSQTKFHLLKPGPRKLYRKDSSLQKEIPTAENPLFPNGRCKHPQFRACKGKFGAYWWCPACDQTASVFTDKANTSKLWLKHRNDTPENNIKAIALAEKLFLAKPKKDVETLQP